MCLGYRSLFSLTTGLALACNAPRSDGTPIGNGGNTQVVASGGTPTTSIGGANANIGGASTNTGGTSTNTGGTNANTGGASTNSGGNTASGGRTITGGTNTGGARSNTGGTTTTGGRSIGGANTGGTSLAGRSTGGRSTGGTTATSTGGASTGGALITAIGGTHSGEATFYASNGNGNCSFGTAVLGMDIAALNQPDYGMATWCGACADVTGPLGTVRVLIQDRCPECKSGDLDLNPEAFDKIALHAAGRVAITWKFVPCNVTGPIKYHFKEGTNTGWTAVQVLNHRLPITTLEYSIDGGTTFKPTIRQEYNYFLEANGFGPNVTFVRVTAATGQTLTDILPFPESDTTIEGQANF